MSTRPSTEELRARLAAAKINIAGPENAAAGMKQGDDFNGSNMILPVMSVKCYDKNPRQTINPKFHEIKQGIKERRKLPGSLAVTRRPGERDYMLYMGGNTRLLVVQELWQETQDPAFRDVAVTYYDWISESDIISAHLIENEARADTTFWDKATGLVTLKQELEKEKKCVLSSAALEEHARKLGMSTNKSSIQNYLFATQYLTPIGPALRLEDLKFLKPRLNSQKQLAQQLQLDPTLYDELLNIELEQYAAEIRQGAVFDAANLCSRLDQKLAQAVNATQEEVRLMMMALSADGHLAGEALRAAAQSQPRPQTRAVSASQPVKEAAVPSSRKRTSDAAAVESKNDRITRSTTPDAKPSTGKENDTSGIVAPADFIAAMRHLASELCEAADVSDCLRLQDDLPLGFYMEMPEELIETTDAADPNIRRAGWQLMAALTGQFNRRFCTLLPADSRWRQTMELDASGERSFETEYQIHVQGICSETGAPGMTCSDLTLSLLHPVVGPLFVQILQHAHQWHGADPIRFSA